MHGTGQELGKTVHVKNGLKSRQDFAQVNEDADKRKDDGDIGGIRMMLY